MAETGGRIQPFFIRSPDRSLIRYTCAHFEFNFIIVTEKCLCSKEAFAANVISIKCSYLPASNIFKNNEFMI